MSFEWRNYLTLAEALFHYPTIPGPQEAALRSAISRAYYAAFGSTREFATLHDNFSPRYTGDDHTRLMLHYRFAPDLVRRRISINLKRLREARNLADYENVLPRDAKIVAQSSVDLARNIINSIDNLFERSTQGVR
jgi:uncharacterized protein (UPF0332 family)